MTIHVSSPVSPLRRAMEAVRRLVALRQALAWQDGWRNTAFESGGAYSRGRADAWTEVVALLRANDPRALDTFASALAEDRRPR